MIFFCILLYFRPFLFNLKTQSRNLKLTKLTLFKTISENIEIEKVQNYRVRQRKTRVTCSYKTHRKQQNSPVTVWKEVPYLLH